MQHHLTIADARMTNSGKNFSDEEIRQAAKKHIANIFKINHDDLSYDAVFGKDLKPSFVSDWKDNELDIISDDIHDVADRQIQKEWKAGASIILTVGDFCEHMVRCYHRKYGWSVADILGLHEREWSANR